MAQKVHSFEVRMLMHSPVFKKIHSEFYKDERLKNELYRHYVFWRDVTFLDLQNARSTINLTYTGAILIIENLIRRP